MKKIIRKSFIPIMIVSILVIFLSSCSCNHWCRIVSSGRNNCHGLCETQNALSKTSTTQPDSVQSVGNPIPQKNAPGSINNPMPGEYFNTTITAGTNMSFKSSDEEYGGGYGDHNPGVGFYAGVGTVLPFNQQFAIAPSVRFTQKNASEEFGYSEPGGGGGMKFEDKYSYNYLGASMLAQFRVGKNLSLVAGPEVNYLLSASRKPSGNSSGEKENLTKSSTKLGVDVMAGVKFDIPAANRRSRLGVQLMYDHRLSRLNKKKNENGLEVPAYKMTGVQLGLAYNINK